MKSRLQERFIAWVAGNQAWGRLVRETSACHPVIVGSDLRRLSVHSSAIVNDALLNIASGRIVIGAHAFFGPGVSLLTGTHDISERGLERQLSAPKSGRDIIIGPGVWLGAGAAVVGPVSIGADAVVTAGSLVVGDVPAGGVVGGVPARRLPASSDLA